MPAPARTLVTGIAHSSTAVADGDADGDTDADAAVEADAEGDDDVAGVADGDGVADIVLLGDALPEPDGAALVVGSAMEGAEADDALECAGDDGASGDGSAVTCALELVDDGTGSSEPTRGSIVD